MLKLLKITGTLVGLVLLAMVAGAAFIHFRGIPHYPIPSGQFQARVTPDAVIRGEKLVNTMCAGCHRNADTHTLAGGPMLDAPSVFGKWYVPNITQDSTWGIGAWTDKELMVLLRTGIKRDGEYSPPLMPKLPHLADNDLEAIIAFLRSDDPLVAPDRTADMRSQPSFLVKFLSTIAWKPLPLPAERISMPDSTNQLELGRYMAVNLDCFSCHSADFKSNDIMNPEASLGYFGGGNRTLSLKGEIMLTSNLTPDPQSGIGNWDEARFIKALRFGQMEGEPALRYPMRPYPELSDEESAAIFAYLKSIPVITNPVPRSGLEDQP